MSKSIAGHEQYDYGPCLRPKLETKGGRNGVKVPSRSAADAQSAFAVFPTYAHARLYDAGKYQNSCGFPHKLMRAVYMPVKST
jgi:hypothetical protein